jgi:hypothetical protein
MILINAFPRCPRHVVRRMPFGHCGGVQSPRLETL